MTLDITITPTILQEFKERMRIEDDYENDYLLRIIASSRLALIKSCGDYDISTDISFKELVFERSRYVYNDALEYFDNNFLSQINNLSIEKALENIQLDSDSDATV
jgi:NifB/MoaA-like Fe-S oxidoreductase